MLAEAKAEGLEKTLGVFDLIILGVGAIIGSGIFAVVGIAAAGRAGEGDSRNDYGVVISAWTDGTVDGRSQIRHRASFARVGKGNHGNLPGINGACAFIYGLGRAPRGRGGASVRGNDGGIVSGCRRQGGLIFGACRIIGLPIHNKPLC